MSRIEVDLACQRLAMSQEGVLSRAQAVAAGMSSATISRRVASGRWERVLPSVYRLKGAPATWRQSLFAALLWAGPESAACGRSAAALLQLEGCKEGPVEIWTPSWRAAPSGIDLCHGRMDRADITVRSDIRLTNVDRTLLDLADRVSRNDVEIALEDALRRRLTTTDRLEQRLDGRWRCVSGVKALRKVVGEHAQIGVTESRFEAKLFALLRRARLPLPRIQHEIRDGGRLVARADFAYPEVRFIIEAHSFRWHSGHKPWTRDNDRDTELRELGWRLLYVTWEKLTKQPDRVVANVRRGLQDPQLFR
ncbi:MAG: hypothetical protein QOG16_1412 [Actinomycetota bacterium]|jgi:very-short-patch-repair endonuclease|nr:hypothetical protein [Actinomycetota bacterium]